MREIETHIKAIQKYIEEKHNPHTRIEITFFGATRIAEEEFEMNESVEKWKNQE